MKALKLLEDDEEPNRKRWRTYDANLPFESGSRAPLGPQFVGAVTGTDQESSPQGTHMLVEDFSGRITHKQRNGPWQVWLRGLSISLWTEGRLVRVLVFLKINKVFF